MAEAKQCDRCGTLYQEKDGDTKPIFVCNTNSLEPFDFCEDCANSLILWFIGRNHGRAKLQEYGIVDG